MSSDCSVSSDSSAGIEHSFNTLTAKTAKITSLHTNNVLGWSPYGGHPRLVKTDDLCYPEIL